MHQKEKCYLCEKSAMVFSAANEAKDAYRVECETCGKYYLAAPAIFEKEYEKMPREKRAMLSAYARERFELREDPPELGDPDLLMEIIAEYEDKSDDEKLKNLIWYLRKKSPQFGDSVELKPEVDYPIVYGLETNDFLQILAYAIDKGLVRPIRGRYEEGIRLTGTGWKLGTDIMKSK